MSLGDSKNTVRGYCLDVPRFEESLNNEKRYKHTFEEQGIRFEEWINRILEIPEPPPSPQRHRLAARPAIHMAAGAAYPPYGCGNNIYTAWTNESLADYVIARLVA